MIWRQKGRDGTIITQNDHGLLCGKLARLIGNGLFAAPWPFDAVVHAIAEHDRGWEEADRHPDLNTQGWPTHVFETDILTAISAWEQSVNLTATGDPYAGLLVSLHTMALANQAAARQPAPEDEQARQRVFRVRRFVHQQIETQEKLRTRLEMRTDLPLRGGLAQEGRSADEDLLRFNFFLLVLLHQISLNLCFGRVVFSRVEMVYPKPGEPAISARMTMDGDGAVTLHPWPFNSETVAIEVPSRRIEGGPFANRAALGEALERSTPLPIGVVLRPGGS